MFGFFTKSRRPSRSVSSRPVRLQVEALETRACPAPVISNFVANELGEGWWTFKGNVTDSSSTSIDGDPSADVVKFEGFDTIQGKTAQVQSDGSFTLLIQLSPTDNGVISATAYDPAQDASNVVYWDVVQ